MKSRELARRKITFKKKKIYISILKGGYKMGSVIAKNVVKRKPGYLYYVDGKGNVCEAKMARGGKKKKKK